MLKVEQYQERARSQFVKMLADGIKWISEHCYPQNLELNVQKLNEVIGAAKTMGVTDARLMSTCEIDELVADLKPLRILDMQTEVKELVIAELLRCGVDPTSFEKPKQD